MGDEICTEEELLAHAIALSLAGHTEIISEGSPTTLGEVGRTPETLVLRPPELPLRTDTTRSYDSVLNEADGSLSESLTLQKHTSQGQLSSSRSSPDLGISPESDIDPQSGTLEFRGSERDFRKSSRESLLSSPELRQPPSPRLKNITLDGGLAASGYFRENPEGEEYTQLPLTRLSSLHDMNPGLRGAVKKAWQPNREALEQIVGTGISENAAKRALYYTENESAELAIKWVFENIANVELHEPFTPSIVVPSQGADPGFGTVCYSYDDNIDLIEGMLEANQMLAGGGLKMVCVVNSSLRMGVGKVAAQVGHAVLGLYRFVEAQQDRKQELEKWDNIGAKKIVLKGTDAQHLLDLKQRAMEYQIANILIHDAGKTQIDPGSLTILALFGRSQEIDCVTGKLKLL